MSEELIPDPDDRADLELLNLGGARQMVSDLVQLIEAKALAQRLAFKTLVQELSAVAGPETAFQVQARLDALQCDPAIFGGEDDGLRDLVRQELNSLVEELDSLVKDT